MDRRNSSDELADLFAEEGILGCVRCAYEAHQSHERPILCDLVVELLSSLSSDSICRPSMTQYISRSSQKGHPCWLGAREQMRGFQRVR